MAKASAKKSTKKGKVSHVSPFSIYWGKQNYLLLLLGVVVIFAGYYFLSMGEWNSFTSLDIAPVLLFVGYVVILPVAVLFNKRMEKIPVEVKDNAAGKN